jgi:hypothetical protein
MLILSKHTRSLNVSVKHVVCGLLRLTILYLKQELFPYYRAEMNPARRTAVCIVAAMYLAGGFYFDVDLVGSPYAPRGPCRSTVIVCRVNSGREPQ